MNFQQLRSVRVTLHLHQGSPQQVAGMLLSGDADIGVAAEALTRDEVLKAFGPP